MKNSFVLKTSIKKLPKLPDHIEYIKLGDVRYIKYLPKMLKHLEIHNSNIEYLCELPETIQTISIRNCNKLKNFPKLTENLTELCLYNVKNVDLSNIYIPKSLIYLALWECRIFNMTSLKNNDNLLELVICNCKLKLLPELPLNLKSLYCSYTDINEMPEKFVNKQDPNWIIEYNKRNVQLQKIRRILIED